MQLENNLKDNLMNLNFHDSEIRKVEVVTCNGNERKCILLIDYYNWENNEKPNSNWQWRKLQITFDFLSHIEWYVPDLVNRHSDILDVEFDCKIEELYLCERKLKEKYPKYVSPIFDLAKGYLSIKFNLSNFDDVTGKQAYLLLIGSSVKLEWLTNECRQGSIHILANSKVDE
jgi:hypothetical protein